MKTIDFFSQQGCVLLCFCTVLLVSRWEIHPIREEEKQHAAVLSFCATFADVE